MIFPCYLKKEEECPSQDKCSIYQAGFCKVFAGILKKRLGFMIRKFPGLRNQEEDFMSEVFSRVIQSLPNLKIRNERGFTAFTGRIMHNVAVDLTRKRKETVLSELLSEEEEEKDSSNLFWDKLGSYEETHEDVLLEEVIRYLEELTKAHDFCGELILFWYESQKKGLKHKDMAQELGLRPNTFNQKLKRCFKRVAKYIFKKKGEKWH